MRTTTRRQGLMGLAVCLALLSPGLSGCVLFGQQLIEEDWEPTDAQFAATITIPFERRPAPKKAPVEFAGDSRWTRQPLAILRDVSLVTRIEPRPTSALR